jgi:hypothetical protein
MLTIPEPLLEDGYRCNNGRIFGRRVICAVHTKVMKPDHQFVADRVVLRFPEPSDSMI